MNRTARGGGRKAHILVTDDRPEVLRLVERTLGSEYECEFAKSVGAARGKLAELPIDLALCGIQMSAGSGLVLVEELAQNHPEKAIVMMTAVDDAEVAERAFRLGAHGYLVKPFWSGQLLVTVANALRQHRLEAAERQHQAALLGSAEEKAEALRHQLIGAQRRAIVDLQASRRETIERLAGAIETHNPEAGQHVAHVAGVATLLGAKLGLSSNHVRLLQAAAPMHDIGKIATPDGVLRKRSRLTSDERKRMESHTTVGHQILAGSESELLRMAATIALTHHERFDGTGYPQGLRGEQIPIEGRIVAVADAFDALLSERPYRPAFTAEEATRLIVSERGTRFDPDVVDALLDGFDEAIALRG